MSSSPSGSTSTRPQSSLPAMPGHRWRGFQALVTFVTIFTFIVGGIALIPAAASADAGVDTGVTSQATDRLKLRSAPALNSEILDVIPSGGTVAITGDPENGFFPVNYNGQDGYAYGAYLTGVDFSGGPATVGGTQGEVNVVDGPVNFRTGPSTSDTVISVIPDGALVALNGDSANGFLGIIYTDRSGWADAASILGTSGDVPSAPAAPVAPETPAEVPVGDTVTGSATVFDGGLNLRSGPGTTYDVVLVLPDGATVELRGEGQDGFLPLSYNGTTGWASAQWLDTDGDDAPVPTEEPATEEPATEEPATEEPATEEPLPTEAPATEAPATEAPATEAPAPTQPAVDGSDGYTEEEIIEIIYAAADQFGQPREDMLRVARCESVLDPNAVNSSSGASGLFQFLPSTWDRTPYADQDVFDPVANAEAAAWMWAEGNRGEWTCQ